MNIHSVVHRIANILLDHGNMVEVDMALSTIDPMELTQSSIDSLTFAIEDIKSLVGDDIHNQLIAAKEIAARKIVIKHIQAVFEVSKNG